VSSHDNDVWERGISTITTSPVPLVIQWCEGTLERKGVKSGLFPEPKTHGIGGGTVINRVDESDLITRQFTLNRGRSTGVTRGERIDVRLKVIPSQV